MHLSTLLCGLPIIPCGLISLPASGQIPLQYIEEASAVPGYSPAHYVGDASNDVLSIQALDLLPDPSIHLMTLRLRGVLTSDIGPEPRIKLTASLNGTVGPSTEFALCSRYQNIEITQNGTSVCPLKRGPMEMSYGINIPFSWLKKGEYTVRTQMYATDGARMTDFEGSVWANGEADGNDGWYEWRDILVVGQPMGRTRG